MAEMMTKGAGTSKFRADWAKSKITSGIRRMCGPTSFYEQIALCIVVYITSKAAFAVTTYLKSLGFSFFRCGYRISIRGYVRPLVRLSVGPSVGPSVRW